MNGIFNRCAAMEGVVRGMFYVILQLNLSIVLEAEVNVAEHGRHFRDLHSISALDGCSSPDFKCDTVFSYVTFPITTKSHTTTVFDVSYASSYSAYRSLMARLRY